MSRKRKKQRSPYQEYHIILEEKEKKFVQHAKKDNCMLLAIVAPLFLPAAAAERVTSESVAITREESMGLTYVIDKVEKEFGLPPDLTLLIETTGGSGALGYKIARLLRSKFEKVAVFVPHFALSAGTMIACIGDEIVMDITSSLGPFDAQIELPNYGFVSASALRKGMEIAEDYYRKRGVADAQNLVERKVDPILQGLLEEVQRAGELYLAEILELAHYPKKVAKKIVRTLVWEYPTHEFPVTMERAIELGLRVSPRSKYPGLWSLMEEWLDRLAFHPDNEDHMIAYTHPKATR